MPKVKNLADKLQINVFRLKTKFLRSVGASIYLSKKCSFLGEIWTFLQIAIFHEVPLMGIRRKMKTLKKSCYDNGIYLWNEGNRLVLFWASENVGYDCNRRLKNQIMQFFGETAGCCWMLKIYKWVFWLFLVTY